MRILHELGMEPFVGWAKRPRGLKTSAVASSLGVSAQLVKDRIARMTSNGVIAGYRLLPNLRHVGQGVTVYQVQNPRVPDPETLAHLGDVDGFAYMVWFFDGGLCINLSHSSQAERDRRVQVMARMVGASEAPTIHYTVDFPNVQRALTELDWRIIATLWQDAKRPLPDVADAIGLTTKTVRTRLQRMREEGSIDEVAIVDFSKVKGIVPFQLAVWAEAGAHPEEALLRCFSDRYLAHFLPPVDGGYCSVLLRIFAFTPPEVQALVRDALAVEGVERAEAMVATGGWNNQQWVEEMLAAHTSAPLP